MSVINSFIEHHRKFWTRKRKVLLLKMLGLLFLAIVIQHMSSIYIGRTTGVPVGDLILSNIPAVDIDILIVQGALVATFIMVGILLWRPRYILFTIGAVSLFIIIRAFFISLTHLGVDPHEIVLDPNDIGFGLYNILYNNKGDFFFSGHTGMPFLFGLIFLHDKFWAKLFFTISVIFGISVLLGHVHYSIDVFAAPFMTYSIFKIAKYLFPEEYALITPVHVDS